MSNRNAIVQRLGLALVLALGLGTALAIAALWGYGIIESFRHEAHISETLRVLGDGTPIIRRTADQNTTVRTLDGKEIAATAGKNARLSHGYAGMLLAAHLPAPLKPTIFDAGPGGSERIDGFSDERTPASTWYFVHDGKIAGSGYFVGFDSRSRLCTGYLGRAGFRLDLPPSDDWFPVDGRRMGHGRYDEGQVFSRAVSYQPNVLVFDWEEGIYAHPRGPIVEPEDGIASWQVAMISDKKLWFVDFRERTATVLMESPELVSVGMFHQAESKDAAPPAESVHWRKDKDGELYYRSDAQTPHFFAVRTRESILVLDPGGKQLRSYTIPAELHDKRCAFYELSDTSALLDWDRALPDDTSRKELWWIDNSGKVVKEIELPLLPDAKPRDTAVYMWMFATSVPVPIIWSTIVFILYPLELLIYGRAPDYGSALARVLPAMGLPMLAILVLAALLAWLCYRRQRQYVLGGTWAWVIFVFLGGVPGMLAYLFHRRWPVLEKCPSCTHAVPHDRETCADCGTPFPPPQPKGIEVFA